MTGRGDDETLDDVPELTPEEERAVTDLLAALPATPMPPEVLARIEAALAAEPALATTAAVTTLAEARDRRRTSRGPLIFRIAASAVAVVGLTALGVALVNRGGSDAGGSTADLAEGATSSSAAASSAAAGAAAPPTGPLRVTFSQKTYTPANLAAQAGALLNPAQPSAVAAGSATSTASSDSRSPALSSGFAAAEKAASSTDKLAACVKELTDGDGRAPLAVDTGRWADQAALVIVLPADGASGQRQVFVVKPTCGTVNDSSDILQVGFLDG